jgi:hypothetical protein
MQMPRQQIVNADFIFYPVAPSFSF